MNDLRKKTEVKNIDEKIELRSERVRHLISDIPKDLVIWGYVIIFFFTIILLIALLSVENPYSDKKEVLIESILRICFR